MSIVENFKTKWTKLHDYCTSGYKVTGRNLKVLAGDTKKLGFAGVVKAIYEDLVVGRTQLEWTLNRPCLALLLQLQGLLMLFW